MFSFSGILGIASLDRLFVAGLNAYGDKGKPLPFI